MIEDVPYRFTVRPLTESEGGGYRVEFPELPGCMSDGDTVEQATVNGIDAMRGWTLAMRAEGHPMPSRCAGRLPDAGVASGSAPSAAPPSCRFSRWRSTRRPRSPTASAATPGSQGHRDQVSPRSSRSSTARIARAYRSCLPCGARSSSTKPAIVASMRCTMAGSTAMSSRIRPRSSRVRACCRVRNSSVTFSAMAALHLRQSLAVSAPAREAPPRSPLTPPAAAALGRG